MHVQRAHVLHSLREFHARGMGLLGDSDHDDAHRLYDVRREAMKIVVYKGHRAELRSVSPKRNFAVIRYIDEKGKPLGFPIGVKLSKLTQTGE